MFRSAVFDLSETELRDIKNGEETKKEITGNQILTKTYHSQDEKIF